MHILTTLIFLKGISPPSYLKIFVYMHAYCLEPGLWQILSGLQDPS